VRLSGREKGMVGLGAAVLAAIGFWLGVWDPVQAHIQLLDRKVRAKQAEQQEIQKLVERFRRLRDQIAGIEDHLKRSKDFSILSYLESLAKRQQVQDRIVQMKPKGGETTRYYRESSVEIKMEKVRLSELVGYLYQVENSAELLRVKQLQIKPRFDDKDLLDVRFQVSAYDLLGAG
jgi:general secretion pathway protein M